MQKLSLLLCVLAACAVLPGCKTPFTWHQEIESSSIYDYGLVRLSPSEHAGDEEFKDFKWPDYAHPVQVTAAQVEWMMRHVNRQTADAAFLEKDIEYLAPKIAGVLRSLEPREWLLFRGRNPTGLRNHTGLRGFFSALAAAQGKRTYTVQDNLGAEGYIVVRKGGVQELDYGANFRARLPYKDEFPQANVESETSIVWTFFSFSNWDVCRPRVVFSFPLGKVQQQ